MAETLNLGTNGDWATKENSLLGYNSENGNYKPLPFDFTRASNGTFVNKSGLIETAANGVPRIDFKDDANGALLLEPQRTNYVLLSNDYTSITGSGYVTPNYGTSPEGLSASRILFAGASQLVSASTSLGTGVVCNFSAYVKGVQGELIRFAAGGVDISHTFSGEWERLSGSATSINSSWNVNTFGGATARDFLMCGAQLEVGSYATSLINTQGSAVTRVADVCSQTPPSGIIGQTEGVAYVEIDWKGNNEESIFSVLHDGTVNNRMDFGYSAVFNSFYFNVRSGGSGQGLMQYASPTIGKYKVAIYYKNNDFALWVNGVNEAIDSSGSVPVTTQYNVGNYISGGREHSIINSKLYNTSLTNAELQALTSL